MKKIVVSIIIGALLGVIGARYLFVGSWLSLIPWGIAGLLIGYWSQKAGMVGQRDLLRFCRMLRVHDGRLLRQRFHDQPPALLCPDRVVRRSMRVGAGVAGICNKTEVEGGMKEKQNAKNKIT